MTLIEIVILGSTVSRTVAQPPPLIPIHNQQSIRIYQEDWPKAFVATYDV